MQESREHRAPSIPHAHEARVPRGQGELQVGSIGNAIPQADVIVVEACHALVQPGRPAQGAIVAADELHFQSRAVASDTAWQQTELPDPEPAGVADNGHALRRRGLQPDGPDATRQKTHARCGAAVGATPQGEIAPDHSACTKTQVRHLTSPTDRPRAMLPTHQSFRARLPRCPGWWQVRRRRHGRSSRGQVPGSGTGRRGMCGRESTEEARGDRNGDQNSAAGGHAETTQQRPNCGEDRLPEDCGDQEAPNGPDLVPEQRQARAPPLVQGPRGISGAVGHDQAQRRSEQHLGGFEADVYRQGHGATDLNHEHDCRRQVGQHIPSNRLRICDAGSHAGNHNGKGGTPNQRTIPSPTNADYDSKNGQEHVVDSPAEGFPEIQRA
mmetsp:Transcript_47108/g.134913  ORF Transcript_47108/g.134913 Transcript_47108/m.134913 type:complete len:383 (+) Transcript_47108:763-1911(+)